MSIIADTTDNVTPERPEITPDISKVVEPNLARFQNMLTDSPAPYLIRSGRPDPIPFGLCPAWCVVDHDDEGVREGFGIDTHRSQPIVLPYRMGTRKEVHEDWFFIPHYEVALDLPGTATSNGWVTVANERAFSPEGAYRQKLTPTEARRLARAILAAADLADPDSEFEEAGE